MPTPEEFNTQLGDRTETVRDSFIHSFQRGRMSAGPVGKGSLGKKTKGKESLELERS